MSNHTVKAQREQWIARASELIKMDDDTRITNYHEALDQMVAELGISADSARTALGHAARRYRSKLFSSTAAAVSLGSTTSERKAAAARVNGKRGGRPRKKQGEKMTKLIEEDLDKFGLRYEAPRGSIESKVNWLNEVAADIVHKVEVARNNGQVIDTNRFPGWEWNIVKGLGLIQPPTGLVDDEDRSGILPGEFGYKSE